MEILPQILTRFGISALVEDLDASDVLECYSLTRHAHLSGQFQNATIQKMALGLRYDPPSNSHKEALELTLEYGPQRIGADLEEESMPFAMRENHLSWENEGKVYFTTTSIQEYRWKSAYYMTSISGVVLEKILDKAVSYSTKMPRYQPFSVVSTNPETGVTKQMLKSSSSVDFVYEMWTEMAELGVDLRPILTPPSYIPRLHIAENVEKVSGYDSEGKYIPQEAATFYKALANCWSAIAAGDYSEYETSMPTSMPSLAPSLTPSYTTPSQVPSAAFTEFSTAEATISKPTRPATQAPTDTPTNEEKDAGNGDGEKDDDTSNDEKSDAPNESDTTGDGKLKAAKTTNGPEDSGESDTNEESGEEEPGEDKEDPISPEDEEEDSNDESDDDSDDANDDDDNVESTGDGRMRSLKQKIYQFTESILPAYFRLEQSNENDTDDVFISELAHHNLTSPGPSSSLLSSSNITMPPSIAPTGDTKSEAQKAANEAHEAAQEAKNASTHDSAEKAADAAEHAADAAQKAANAAKWEKDMEDLLSGDGQLVTQAFAQCWIDPRYGIASENTSAIIGYMYYDGNFYYRLNLTLPYLDVVEHQRPIPQKPTQSSATVDDFVDWTLAFVVMGLTIFGIFLFVQQIGLRLMFYGRQKYFFNPTKHGEAKEDELGYTMNDDDSVQHGRGQEHGFPADVIPLSMGGRKPTFRNSQLLVTNSPTTERRVRAVEEEGDVELTDMAFMPGLDGDDAAPTTQLPPLRFTRHPDLVDLPNLTSHSKVAQPVTTTSLSDHGSTDSIERMQSL